ncbi:DUF58 domain-containing protein [Phytoactinopolyspora halotolerans]|uniref:DUF58 domain-containing protein n=1 Tax=Phytoactinopolyspora halotolerans TaxID=1981512 RepID=A0A6L9SF44_9ACTN|nr:DUF58 domain-containing protein [Phytoactinopolyspora halotolerans]NEE03082.1 DUF58 domain-containing protein [Phytoactinopolyspora halotolerans]
MGRSLSGLTTRGWAFVSLGGGITLSAVLIGQRDLLRVGILLLILPLTSLLVAARSRVRLAASRTVEPSRVQVGSRATVHLELSNATRIPTGVVLVEDTLPYTLGSRPRFVLDHVWSRFRREVTYAIQPSMRGRYPVGPLAIRVTDPFGLVELRRSFDDVGTLVVTPTVWRLPAVRLVGEWSGSGETRPRAIATAGEEDATIRVYRDGDDMRRVHWRATAHHGELMVRREEQPWQSRAGILLDTRLGGHIGDGPDSSLEWAVSAAASIGVHLTERGYSVQLFTDAADAAHAGDTDHRSPAHAADSRVALLDRLAVVSASRHTSVAHWQEMLAGTASGMLIAVLGRLHPEEANMVARLRQGSSAALAILLDVPSWTTMANVDAERIRQAEVVQNMRRGGWSVVTAGRNEHLASVWEGLGLQRGGGPAMSDDGRATSAGGPATKGAA